ncbi:MAG TPA: hypothetical protein VGN51_19690 [Acidimicrobiia bacterium]|jgi:hypothetical protein
MDFATWGVSDGALVIPVDVMPDRVARTFIGPGLRYELTEDGVRDHGASGPAADFVPDPAFDRMFHRLLGGDDMSGWGDW